jgi:hypothetical protein
VFFSKNTNISSQNKYKKKVNTMEQYKQVHPEARKKYNLEEVFQRDTGLSVEPFRTRFSADVQSAIAAILPGSMPPRWINALIRRQGSW